MGVKYYEGCNQRIPEYHSWVCLNAGMKVKSYVELGCGSAHFLLQAGVEKVVTVDLLPNGVSGVPHIQANTQDPQTINKVLDLLGGEYPDVVFIDADHEDAGVRKDFELWYPIAQQMVGFHDILMPSVQPFWNEICLRYPSVQIIGRDVGSADKWQHGVGVNHPDGRVNCGGVGVIFK